MRTNQYEIDVEEGRSGDGTMVLYGDEPILDYDDIKGQWVDCTMDKKPLSN